MGHIHDYDGVMVSGLVVLVLSFCFGLIRTRATAMEDSPGPTSRGENGDEFTARRVMIQMIPMGSNGMESDDTPRMILHG